MKLINKANVVCACVYVVLLASLVVYAALAPPPSVDRELGMGYRNMADSEQFFHAQVIVDAEGVIQVQKDWDLLPIAEGDQVLATIEDYTAAFTLVFRQEPTPDRWIPTCRVAVENAMLIEVLLRGDGDLSMEASEEMMGNMSYSEGVLANITLYVVRGEAS